MENANVYAYITPIALGFILLEISYCRIFNKKYITFSESIANFGTALGNQTVNILVMLGVYVVYQWIWDNFRIIDGIQLNWWTFILLLLGVDFVFYWVHRWGHQMNIMWAAHSPHHSAEEMNFIVAVRASVTQRLASFLFFWVLAVVGFRPVDIYMVVAIHLFIAFFHHTEIVYKLWRPIEFLFTTPSHHRVHHGVNPQYLDRNFGEFLIIWDRMFGSFEEEREKPVYGILDHPKTWNPIFINFHYYIVLWKNAVAAPFWWDKVRIWFMPAGWRPRGLAQFDKPVIHEESQVERFRPAMFANAKIYLLIQCALAVLLMMGVISNMFHWNGIEKWIGAALLWWQIINWGGILEAKGWIGVSEPLRAAVTAGCVIAFSGVTEPSLVLFAIMSATAYSILWPLIFFRPGSQTLATA